MIKNVFLQERCMNSSFELLVALKKAGYPRRERDRLWWPKSKTFWVIVGAILTQQTKWENVEKSMANLESAGIASLDALSKLDVQSLADLIKPSGFYNTKAKNLHLLSHAIINVFGDFESFCFNVDREWLLSQKGIGEESADSILCYACAKEVLVVDAYTSRLLEAFGYEFDSYGALQEWMIGGLSEASLQIETLYGRAISINELYARFHGKIVEFCKENSSGKKVNIESLGL